MKKKEYYQFKFSDNFNTLENEKVMDYYKSFDEVPKYIKEFVYSELDKNVIKDYDNDRLYCPICLGELNNLYCNSCKKNFENKYIRRTQIKELKEINSDMDLRYNNYCCVFDFKDDNPLLYCINASVNYRIENSIYIHRIVKINLEDVYSIESDRIVEVKYNKVFLYDDIDEFLKVDEIRKQFMFYYDPEMLEFKLNKVDKDLSSNIYYNFFCEYSLYKGNLDELKKYDLFKYSYLWELKNNDRNVLVASLSYYPLHIKSFEFLMKLGLYNLAISCPLELNKGKTFKDRFGFDKKYLEIIKHLNIDYNGLMAFRLYPTNNEEVFNFVLEYYHYYKDINKFIDAEKLMNYLNKNDIDFYTYYDYITELSNQGYDMKDNSLLYPKDFKERHDRLFIESIILRDKDVNEKINALSKIYSMNIYEDDKYIIFPANSIESLVDESSQMSNCVKNYCERISDKDSQIYFMRKKSNRSKSLITIEVYNNKVTQALGRFNKEINNEEKMVVNKFEKSLVNIKIIE